MHIFAKENIIATILIILLGSLAYSTSIEVPFVLDDADNIENDVTVRITSLSYDDLSQASFSGHHHDRPLAKLSFALNYYFGKYDVTGYHLVNIAIHLITAILLYWFILLTLNSPAMQGAHTSYASVVAATSALIWLLHPVQVQSVTYIVQRMTSMATMFYMLSFLFYIRGRLALSRRSCLLFFLGGMISWILSLAAKPIGVTLPVFIILYEWFFFQSLDRQWLRKNIPLFSLSVIMLLIIVFYFMGADPIQSIMEGYRNRAFSPGERVLTEFRVVVFYLSLMLLPLPGRLNLEHDFTISHSFFDPLATLVALLFLIFLAIMAVTSCKKQRFVSFAILWFFGGLLLESSIVGLELVFEHRLYLPSMLIFALLPLGLARLVGQKRFLFYLLSPAVLLLCFLTYNRNIIWQNHHSLLQDCLSKSPGSARIQNNLGNLFLSEGRFVAAEPLLAKAMRSRPRYLDATYNMGNLMQRTARYDQAIYYYKQALAIHSSHIGSLNNLGIIYAQRGEFPKAREYFQQIITLQPDHEVGLTNLGMVLEDMGQIDEAIFHYRKALLMAPNSREISSYLKRTLRKKASGSR